MSHTIREQVDGGDREDGEDGEDGGDRGDRGDYVGAGFTTIV
ncbi:hypothetical protein [Coleofasciculus sp. F4-SAH-05]